jgi:hypothetical protein
MDTLKNPRAQLSRWELLTDIYSLEKHIGCFFPSSLTFTLSDKKEVREERRVPRAGKNIKKLEKGCPPSNCSKGPLGKWSSPLGDSPQKFPKRGTQKFKSKLKKNGGFNERCITVQF